MIRFNDADWKFLRVALGAWKKVSQEYPRYETRIHFSGTFQNPANYLSIDQFITPTPDDTDEELTIVMDAVTKLLKKDIDRTLGFYASHILGLRWNGKPQKNELALPLREVIKAEVYRMEKKGHYFVEVSSVNRKCVLQAAQIVGLEKVLLYLSQVLYEVRSAYSVLKPLNIWHRPDSLIPCSPCSIYFLR